ncbi:DJ-1/PfpI family protein [Prodigiosinella confusarubida]|nr:DJ-1/PfpI family protein [Serratia sp. ATCC 39006]
MNMSQANFRTVFVIYPGMTPLDFVGPYECISRLPNSETQVASLQGGTVSGDGLAFANTVPLAGIDRCDLICVPGGLTATQISLDAAFIGHIRRLGHSAQYVTSVCTGSLILGAAGFLQGKHAACHWALRELLPLYGAIPDAARVVRDGRLITGGGVTAGIDFALTVLAEIAGDTVAQSIQLRLEYAPEPPFNAGRPETAPADVLALYTESMAHIAPQRQDEVREATRRLRVG